MIKRFLLQNIEKHASKSVVLIIDLFIISSVIVLTYMLRFGIGYDFTTTNIIFHFPILFFISLIYFLTTGSYKGVIRQTGAKDIYLLATAITLNWLTVLALVKLNRVFSGPYFLNIPYSVIHLYPVISLISLIISRIVFKYGYYYVKYNLGQASKLRPSKVLIYGAGEVGLRTLNTIVNNSERTVVIEGFVDDDKNKAGRTINGIKIYHSKTITAEFIQKKAIKEGIICIENISVAALNKISNRLIDLGLKIKKVPNYKDWINGKLQVSQIRKVSIEDLLERPSIKIENELVPKELSSKVIMVTGAAGSIGSELVRQLVKYKYKRLIILDQAESALYNIQQELVRSGVLEFETVIADIRNQSQMEYIMKRFSPEIIFHAAAYKHVPLMEKYPAEAIKTNILGTVILADLADALNVEKFVLISTDKAVNPTNVMGATKRASELYIHQKENTSNTKFIATRFGNVLGSAGSVIPLFNKQIKAGGPVTVTHREIERYFMTIPEATQLVIEAAAMGKGGEIFVFDMGEPVKIFDLAKKMIQLSGYNYPDDINIQFTGLRPGEKLYEELLSDTENTTPTYHKKIMIYKPNNLNLNSTYSIKNFFEMDFNGSNVHLVKLLKFIVPEFKSNNSVYENIDEELQVSILRDK